MQSATRTLRILHIFNYLGLGGTELTALRMIANLEKDLFENELCAVRGFDPTMVIQRYPQGRVAVPDGDLNGFQLMISRLVRIIKKVKPHIVHSRNWGTIEAIPAARLAHVPVVIHSEHGYEVTNVHGMPLRQRLLRRAVYPLANAFVTVTNELRDYHASQAWVSAKRIRVIENGIDTQLYCARPSTRAEARQKLEIPENRFVVGTVGRLVAIKDHGTLLKAVENVARGGVNIHAVIAGSGPELNRHQQMVTSSDALAGRVSFLGAVQEVWQVLNALDVFVLTSLSEGMSNTLLEAMASCLPVIATGVGGNREVVEEGRSGWLFTVGDEQELSNRLRALAADANLRESFGTAARERVVRRFSLDRMVEEYRRLYTGLAQQCGILNGSSG